MSFHPNIFLVTGHPRSGTTLLSEILNRHPRVRIPAETHFFLFPAALRHLEPAALRTQGVEAAMASFRQANPRFAGCFDADTHAAFAAHLAKRPPVDAQAAYLELFGFLAAADLACHVGEKTPDHIFQAIALAERHPGLRVVDIVRDPRAVFASWRAVPFGSQHPGFVALRWKRAVTTARRVGAALGARFLQIRYEDLVHDPETVVRRVVAHLGLDFVPELLEESSRAATYTDAREPWKARSHAAITTTSAEKWRRELSPAAIDVIETLSAPVIAEMGYALTPAAGPFDQARRLARGNVARLGAAWSVAQRKLSRRRHGDSLKTNVPPTGAAARTPPS